MALAADAGDLLLVLLDAVMLSLGSFGACHLPAGLLQAGNVCRPWGQLSLEDQLALMLHRALRLMRVKVPLCASSRSAGRPHSSAPATCTGASGSELRPARGRLRPGLCQWGMHAATGVAHQGFVVGLDGGAGNLGLPRQDLCERPQHPLQQQDL